MKRTAKQRTAAEDVDWSTLSPHLDHALELGDAERKQWLAGLAEANPDLAKSLIPLLAEIDALDEKGFLVNPPPLPGGHASMRGKRIGAYSLERVVGRGGMGVVWLASRSDGQFEGKCAIKFIGGHAASPRLESNFRREVRILARLAHANIARLLDAGATDEGRQYLVLEYVDGERIDQYCHGRGLNVKERVRLFMDVVSAVAHAHASLIVHRDLKPANVLVTKDGTVKLLDFGIAKLVENEGDAPVTKHEETALTPEYAAPEQLLRRPLSTATDVYQLGMLLFVLLTGQYPREANSERANRIDVIWQGDLPRASERSNDSAGRSALRGDLDAILAMALRRNAEDRYATAAAFREDIVRYLEGEPVVARRGASFYRARKLVLRHRFASLIVTLAVAGLCAALGYAVERARESKRQRDEATASASRWVAQNSFMELMMSELGEPGHPIAPEKILDSGIKLLDTQYAGDPDFVVRQLIHISGRYVNWGDREREYGILLKAESIAKRSGSDRIQARVQCNMVESEMALGRFALAIERLNAGRAALASAHKTQPRVMRYELPDEIDCLTAAAAVSAGQGRVRDAIRDLESGVVLMDKVPPLGHVNIRYALMLHRLGKMHGLLGNDKKADQYFIEAQATAEKSGYARSPVWRTLVQSEARTLRDVAEVN